MKYIFTQRLPNEILIPPILISGIASNEYSGIQYLILNHKDSESIPLEIRYEYHCSPFKSAMVINSVVAVGFEEFFYLFDLATQQNLLSLKMYGYFGHLYFDEGSFYVADAGSIYCINQEGKIIWKNVNLGIDGVLIESFSSDKICGTGEWDPPGGWIEFILDKKTGKKI